MNKVIIKVRNIQKNFKNNLLFTDINLTLQEGKIYGFIGPNGCGKSILFKILCGFIAPDKGFVEIFNKKLGIDIDFPENTGVLIESPGFLDDFSQYENLKFLASIKNVIGKKEIMNTLKIVGLDVNNKDKVKKFSLGMKQRLGIAQAIMEKPKILILDEPFNGLDKSGVQDIRTLLNKLKKEGKTILLTSHIGNDIDILADNIFEFNNKTLVKKEYIKPSNTDLQEMKQ